LRDEVDIAKSALGQVNVMITGIESMDDPFEYADSLDCLKDSKRILGWNIMGLNQRFEDIEGESRTFEGICTSRMQQSTQMKVFPTARRLEIPLSRVCTAIEEMMKKLPVKDRWQLH
nr:hypothetical protein [Tanacetum cinerariifolium]